MYKYIYIYIFIYLFIYLLIIYIYTSILNLESFALLSLCVFSMLTFEPFHFSQLYMYFG